MLDKSKLSILISPFLNFTNPLSSLENVDFPEPFLPIIVTNSLPLISRLISDRANSFYSSINKNFCAKVFIYFDKKYSIEIWIGNITSFVARRPVSTTQNAFP